jgi:hypothetical protein
MSGVGKSPQSSLEGVEMSGVGEVSTVVTGRGRNEWRRQVSTVVTGSCRNE